MGDLISFMNLMNVVADVLIIEFLLGYVFWFLALVVAVIFPVFMVARFIYNLMKQRESKNVTNVDRDYDK